MLLWVVRGAGRVWSVVNPFKYDNTTLATEKIWKDLLTSILNKNKKYNETQILITVNQWKEREHTDKTKQK